MKMDGILLCNLFLACQAQPGQAGPVLRKPSMCAASIIQEVLCLVLQIYITHPYLVVCLTRRFLFIALYYEKGFPEKLHQHEAPQHS